MMADDISHQNRMALHHFHLHNMTLLLYLHYQKRSMAESLSFQRCLISLNDAQAFTNHHHDHYTAPIAADCQLKLTALVMQHHQIVLAAMDIDQQYIHQAMLVDGMPIVIWPVQQRMGIQDAVTELVLPLLVYMDLEELANPLYSLQYNLQHDSMGK